MHAVIDTAQNVSEHAAALAAAGVRTVIRYYNHSNSPRLPTKALTRREADALRDAGLSLAVVFQQRGGAGGEIGDFAAGKGTRDAARALQLAAAIGQPNGSGLYFAVDHDYYRPEHRAAIARYFTEVNASVAGAFRIGVYGSGGVGAGLRQAGLVELTWIAGASRWWGTPEALRRGDWSLYQAALERRSPIGGFIYDGNLVNAADPDFGQFGGPDTAFTTRALMRVKARAGLRLRSGPGETYEIIDTIPYGTIVRAVRREGEWVSVDLGSDGAQDGFMFEGFLQPVSGGLPTTLGAGARPLDIARAELALDIREVAGPRDHNPRIVMYHATTSGGAQPDETAWCSSFVNYCVEQAGLRGTDSTWARSWHDADWGRDVTNAPEEGDIVVWRRRYDGKEGGHVGFLLSADANSIEVLGGNQSNRVRIQRYPRAGVLGGQRYDLLSIRRP